MKKILGVMTILYILYFILLFGTYSNAQTAPNYLLLTVAGGQTGTGASSKACFTDGAKSVTIDTTISVGAATVKFQCITDDGSSATGKTSGTATAAKDISATNGGAAYTITASQVDVFYGFGCKFMQIYVTANAGNVVSVCKANY